MGRMAELTLKTGKVVVPVEMINNWKARIKGPGQRPLNFEGFGKTSLEVEGVKVLDTCQIYAIGYQFWGYLLNSVVGDAQYESAFVQDYDKFPAPNPDLGNWILGNIFLVLQEWPDLYHGYGVWNMTNGAEQVLGQSYLGRSVAEYGDETFSVGSKIKAILTRVSEWGDPQYKEIPSCMLRSTDFVNLLYVPGLETTVQSGTVLRVGDKVKFKTPFARFDRETADTIHRNTVGQL